MLELKLKKRFSDQTAESIKSLVKKYKIERRILINKIKASSNHPSEINKILSDLDDHSKMKASMNFKKHLNISKNDTKKSTIEENKTVETTGPTRFDDKKELQISDVTRNLLRVSNTFVPIESCIQSPRKFDPSPDNSGSAIQKTLSSPTLAERGMK